MRFLLELLDEPGAEPDEEASINEPFPEFDFEDVLVQPPILFVRPDEEPQ